LRNTGLREYYNTELGEKQMLGNLKERTEKGPRDTEKEKDSNVLSG
jgi:hypothetical protein